jgi:hypothetical protein
LKYTTTHEWIRFENNNTVGIVGITDHAQSALGDIVFVELPSQYLSNPFSFFVFLSKTSYFFLKVLGRVSSKEQRLEQLSL